MTKANSVPLLIDKASPNDRHWQTVVLVLLLQVFFFLHMGLRYHQDIHFVQTWSWWIHTAVVFALNIFLWNRLARRRKCWAWTSLQAFGIAMLGAGQAVAPADRPASLLTSEPSLLELCLSGGSPEVFWVYAIAFGELVNPRFLIGPVLVAATTGLIVVHQRRVRQNGYAFRQRQLWIFGLASLALALVQYGRPNVVGPWNFRNFQYPGDNSSLRMAFMTLLLVIGMVCITAACAVAVYRVRWLRKVKSGLVPGVALRERRSDDPRSLPTFCRAWSSKQQLVLVAIAGGSEKRLGLVLGI